MTAFVMVGGCHGDDEEGQSDLGAFVLLLPHAETPMRPTVTRSGGSRSRAGGGVKI